MKDIKFLVLILKCERSENQGVSFYTLQSNNGSIFNIDSYNWEFT